MGDLIIKNNPDSGRSGQEECLLFAKYFVENLKAPHKQIRQVTFKSIHPDDPRAPAVWNLMTQMDISDKLNLSVDAGGVSNINYYVEGSRKVVRVLNPEFDYMEVSPNLSPEALYATNVFE